MAKNRKSKPRLSASVTRSGRIFSDPSKSRSSSKAINHLQVLAKDLATPSTISVPISGLVEIQQSPVSSLLVKSVSDRWTDLKISSNFDSVSKNKGTVDVAEKNSTLLTQKSAEVYTFGANSVSEEGGMSEGVELVESIVKNLSGPDIYSARTPSVRPNDPFISAHQTKVLPNSDLPSVNQMPVNDKVNTTAVPNSPLYVKFPSQQLKQSYASCFSSLPRCAGIYCPRVFHSSTDNPHPPAEIIQEGVNFWKDHLVGFFLDTVAPNVDLRDLCRRVWKLRGGLGVNAVNGMYYFKFSIMEERRKVLESDPTIIGGKPFIITSWSASIEKARESVSSIPVWTIFTRIPSALQTLPGLNWLASRIGKFKCFDVNTEARKNLIFAKALIEITPNRPLPKKLKVTIEGYDFFVGIQYSWQPDICTNCHSFGHLLESCSAIGPSKVRPPLLKPLPSIWVRKHKENVNTSEAEPSTVIEMKGKSLVGENDLKENEESSMEGESEDDGICWMSDDRAWLHEVSGIRYDPIENEYYKYVSTAVDDDRRLEYQVVGDSFELIKEGVLGEKNQSLFHDSSWDWECEFRSPNPCFVPGLAVFFSVYVNVIGTDSDSSSYSTLVGD